MNFILNWSRYSKILEKSHFFLLSCSYWAFSFERKNGTEGRQVSNNKGDIAGQVRSDYNFNLYCYHTTRPVSALFPSLYLIPWPLDTKVCEITICTCWILAHLWTYSSPRSKLDMCISGAYCCILCCPSAVFAQHVQVMCLLFWHAI